MLATGSLLAQDIGAADALAAQAETAAVAAMLNRAAALASNQQFGRAVALWREVVQEWDPGNARALEALGFVKVGEVWRRDANKAVAEIDLKGDAKLQKKIDQEWSKTEKEIAKLLDGTARAFAVAGRSDRALQFWRRLVTLRPGDKQAVAAIAAINATGFDGHSGSPSELAMLRRGRAFAQGVEFLRGYEPAVAPAEGQNPLMQKAGIAHQGMRTDHFVVWGALPPERLKLAAQAAERGLLLSRLMFTNADGERFVEKKHHDILWTADRAVYQKTLDAAAEQFDRERLRFLKEDVELAFVRVGNDYQRLYTLANGTGDDFLVDVTARGVVQDASGIENEGLWEGIGHAAVALLFDRTLSFYLEQPQGNTVTNWKPKPLQPDMETWRQIAQESAWAKNDTPSARLVLLQGHKMTNDERVKAWSMCDWLVRVDPTLLMQLAASRTETVRDADAVTAEFQKRAGRSLADLDESWREYWGKGQALRKAMAAAPSGKKEAVQDARLLATAIFRARAAADAGPGGFVVATSAAAQSVHDWLQKKAKFEEEQRRAKANPKKPVQQGPPPEPPAPPAACGTTVIHCEGADPAAAVAAWMMVPALRDFLIDPARTMFACSKGPHAFVLELAGEVPPTVRGAPTCYPRDGQHDVPGTLGDGGTPVSLHCFREVDAGQLSEITCVVTANGARIPGTLEVIQGKSGLSARGCVAFTPRSPLPPGVVEVAWTVPLPLRGGRDVPAPRAKFTVR